MVSELSISLLCNIETVFAKESLGSKACIGSPSSGFMHCELCVEFNTISIINPIRLYNLKKFVPHYVIALSLFLAVCVIVDSKD